jgi:hypothetical protein
MSESHSFLSFITKPFTSNMFVRIEKSHSNCQRIKAIAMHFTANNSFTSGISHTTPMLLFLLPASAIARVRK